MQIEKMLIPSILDNWGYTSNHPKRMILERQLKNLDLPQKDVDRFEEQAQENALTKTSA